MTTSLPKKFRMVERKPTELWVDPHVQRSLRKHRVDTLAKEFNAGALGVVTTSFRDQEHIHVIDGQHRLRAAELAGYDGLFLTMEYHGLTIPQEAALFRDLNNSERPTIVDKFHLAVVAEDPAAVDLNSILASHGWEVGPAATSTKISAIGALQRVYAKSPTAASAAIGVLTAAYGRRPAAMQGSIIEGVGLVFAKYGDAIDFDALAARLAQFKGGPDGMIGNARGLMAARSGGLATQIARIVVTAYNKNRRTTALPDWP